MHWKIIISIYIYTTNTKIQNQIYNNLYRYESYPYISIYHSKCVVNRIRHVVCKSSSTHNSNQIIQLWQPWPDLKDANSMKSLRSKKCGDMASEAKFINLWSIPEDSHHVQSTLPDIMPQKILRPHHILPATQNTKARSVQTNDCAKVQLDIYIYICNWV